MSIDPPTSAASGSGVHDLDLSSAATAIRTGAMTAESYATRLLDRAADLAGLNAFITIDRAGVLEAARAADTSRSRGRSALLLGVPIGVKDSYLTRGLATSAGTSVLKDFVPGRDAAAVSALQDAGAIVFGKNNLAEMSYGLTGINDHHGQVKNPHHHAHITGGSSSGAGAAVAARIVPAALGGDTIGSIRVPASLCGVVGFKPTPGRWPSDGAFPISPTLDTAGVLARSVADCLLIDTVVAGRSSHRPAAPAGLKGVRLAHAPRQHLAGVDPAVAAAFRETLRTLVDAGAELVEIDLGADFNVLAEQVTWPIFFHETLPAIRAFVAAHRVPASFERIHEGLGSHFKGAWTGHVVPGAPGFVPEEAYRAVMTTHRPELQRRYAATVFAQADALLLPTTPCAAPAIADQFRFTVAGREVSDLFLSRNTCPASGAGLPGISIPMRVPHGQLPLGLELEAAAGGDRELLALAQRIEQVLVAAAVP